ncbi:MAG: VTT domain-containing protein [Patescibacteria group bacterium]
MSKIIISWRHIITVVLVLIIFAVIYWLLYGLVFSLDMTGFNKFINQFGATAPLVMIGLIAIEVVVAPLPGGWLAVATGYMFGSGLGFLYAFIGTVLGSAVAFELSHWLGRPFAIRLVGEQKYNLYSEKIGNSKIGLWLLYLIPLFPTDVLSFVLGVSGMRRKDYYLIMILGYLPNIIALNFIGEGISQPKYRYAMLALVAVVLVYFVWKTTAKRVIHT